MAEGKPRPRGMIPPKPGRRPRRRPSVSPRVVVRRLKTSGAVAIAAGLTVLIIAGIVTNDEDGSTRVPAPTGEMRVETATQLARATAVQGVCYGWWLSDGSTGADISRGSNLGPLVPVSDDLASCPKWVEVRATVRYTDPSSESEDWASVELAASIGISAPPASRLAGLGFDQAAFVDDPAWAICEAALALPLLMAETGRATPAPLPTAGTTPQTDAMPAAGSDFWRDRRWHVLAAGLILVAGALMLAIGWFERKHERAPRRRPARKRPASKRTPAPTPPQEAP